MNDDNERRNGAERDNERALTLDEVLATQPEIGPSIPDGGFGWVVFIATLFFQFLVPSLIVNFGIFLAFSKLENGTSGDKNIALWDDNVLYVALFFAVSRSFFDPFARLLASNTTTPRLISVVGTCLTCAGLLFMWMGMTAKNEYWLFVPAGLLSGLGASIVLIECETIVSQYFRLKLPVLNQISSSISIFGFLLSPIILGHHLLTSSLAQILLWYQVIILQGLVVSLVFKKPQYLKSKKRAKPYEFVLSNPDDEEDILSKNSRELQIKRQTSNETHVSKIAIAQPEASTSVDIEEDPEKKTWVNFEEEDEDVKYAKIHEWEIFDEESDEEEGKSKKPDWERFEDEPSSPRIVNNLSLAEETNTQIKNRPSPLFADFPVNNNNTYAYDDEILPDTTNTNVFMPNNAEGRGLGRHLNVLKEPTFYKTLLMMVANTYSNFAFFALYPSYLYIEGESVNARHMTEIVGVLSLVSLLVLSIAHWIKLEKKRRAVCFGLFYWMGCTGYFMISDFTREYLLIVGGVQIILSIAALEHYSKPLLKLPVRGGTSSENLFLSVLSSLALLLLLLLDVTFKTCFRLVAILHFFTGSLWFANFAYKKIRHRLF